MAFSTNSLTVTLQDIAKMIDHSLLHPTMKDTDIVAGLMIARDYHVATACVNPYLIRVARTVLDETDVLVCPVIGFPHGNSTTEVKVFEVTRAAEEGGKEFDMVISIGKTLGEDWEYMVNEIRQINEAVVQNGAILKVIFENNFLEEHHIIRLCHICSEIGVAFVKTSTDYGFFKQLNGMYTYAGATVLHLKFTRGNLKQGVQVKATGGVRTLDDLLHVMSLGVTRIGATATVAIMEEAKKSGITERPTKVDFGPIDRVLTGGY